jgi:hypothetical protein
MDGSYDRNMAGSSRDETLILAISLECNSSIRMTSQETDVSTSHRRRRFYACRDRNAVLLGGSGG